MCSALAVSALIGFGGGIIVSGGLSALIAELDVISAFAQRTDTADKTALYENCAAAGGIAGALFSLFPVKVRFGKTLLPVFGLFSGIFTGCQAMALAEALNVLPVLSGKMNLAKYLSLIIAGAALGKSAGALIFFLRRW